MRRIFIDADACPVKKEVYRVAQRYGFKVLVVSNSYLQLPGNQGDLELVMVGDAPDAADDWIVAHIETNDICITADIPLAARCLERNAHALRPRGKPFDEDSIGDALATRQLMADLRETGQISGGPPPISAQDRSRFLQALDRIIQQSR